MRVNNMSANHNVAIDEMLYPTRGGILFKTYNKDKPGKHVLNFRSLGSWRWPYVYFAISYTRQPVEMTDTHIKDTFSLVQRLVESYKEHGYSLKGTNISMNKNHISTPLVKWLPEKNITFVETIQTNRKGLLFEMRETKDREEFSWASWKEDNGPVILNSYVVKTKSVGKRNVLL